MFESQSCPPPEPMGTSTPPPFRVVASSAPPSMSHAAAKPLAEGQQTTMAVVLSRGQSPTSPYVWPPCVFSWQEAHEDDVVECRSTRDDDAPAWLNHDPTALVVTRADWIGNQKRSVRSKVWIEAAVRPKA
jgi:hypothetical protein